MSAHPESDSRDTRLPTPAVSAVGIRELSRETTAVLRRVESGERVIVRRRGEPVAVIFSKAAADEFLLLHSPRLLGLRSEARAELSSGEEYALESTEAYAVSLSGQAADGLAEAGASARGKARRGLRRIGIYAPRGRAAVENLPEASLRAATDGEIVILHAGYLRVLCELDHDARLVRVLAITTHAELRREAFGLSGVSCSCARS